jgi:hypothetical protein
MSPENSLNASILLHQSGRLAEVWVLHQQILVESPRLRRQREPLLWHAEALSWQCARDLAELECLGATGSDPRFFFKTILAAY